MNMSVLICIQTIWHSDSFLKDSFEKVNFEKSVDDNKSMKNHPVYKRVKPDQTAPSLFALMFIHIHSIIVVHIV